MWLYDIIILSIHLHVGYGGKMKVGKLVIKLVKRYWNQEDMWEVYIKNSKSIGFIKRTITKYYSVWSSLLQYGKDSVEFSTKREAVEYLVGSEE